MPAWLIPAIQAGVALTQQLLQNKANKNQAEWAYGKDSMSTDLAYQRELELMKYQNSFNSPAAQMQRFKDAGLNPNLIYGQGTPGNMQAPRVPQQAPAKAAQISIPNPMTDFMQARLMQAQTDLIETKTDESGIKQDLMKVQQQVAEANPYLAPGYLDALVSQMKSNAAIKQQESFFKTEMTQVQGGRDTGVPMGIATMQKQFALLEQKFDLGGKDAKIKAQIIQSKAFQNELSRIQTEWMKDAEITPQHIYQFIMMFLQSLMR